MRDDIWIEDDEPRRKPRSILGIVAIAAVPWLIVAGMVLLPDRHPPPADDPRGADHEAPEAHPDGRSPSEDDLEGGAPEDPAGDPLADEPSSDEPRSEEPGSDSASAEAPGTSHGGGRSANGAPAGEPTDAAIDRLLAATATVVARAWATGVDPHLDVPGIAPAEGARYAEHVAVESIEREGEDLAVVTLIAVVLEDLEDGLGAELRRLAVPLAIDDGVPRLAGVPWWLAPPRIEAAEPRREVVPSPEIEAEAEAALVAAGYREVEVAAVHRTAGWPWIVEVVGLAPGGEPIAGALWLRLDDDRFVLAGDSGRADTGGDDR